MARILIIEDDLEISGLLSEFLLENGYQTYCLYNGLHVPEVLQEYRPDLVLLDLMLPYRSGDQVLTGHTQPAGPFPSSSFPPKEPPAIKSTFCAPAPMIM